MKRRTIRKIVIVTALAVAGLIYYPYWSAKKDFEGAQRLFRDLSSAVETAAEENSIDRNAEYAAEIAGWNDKFAARLKRIFTNYRNKNRPHITTSVDVAEILFDAIFELRNETIPLYAPLFTDRMSDKNTLAQEEEFEWRLGVLDEIDRYNLRYQSRILEITEAFRSALVNSGLPEKYRVFIWDHWAHNIPDYINKLGPPVTAIDGITSSYRRLFHFMFEHRNAFYINQDGKLVFTDSRRAAEYQSLKYAAGMLDW